MMRYGAMVLLFKAWISQSCHYHQYNEILDESPRIDEEQVVTFLRRLPKLSPSKLVSKGEECFAVCDLLEIIRCGVAEDKKFG
jgi:hypothetical protein